MTATALPRTIEALTPQWFTQALAERHPGVKVEQASIERIIWGSATKVFVQLQYSANAQGLPAHLCVKGGFDERSRAYGLGAAYELEGWFYRELSPRLHLPHPKSYYAGIEPQQAIIIMEDLAEQGASFCNGVELWGVDAVAQTLEALAQLHGQTRNTPRTQYRWIPVGCEAARRAFDVMLSPEQFHPLIARDEIPDLPPGMRDDARVRQAFAALWTHDDAAEHVINHGDAHVGQLYRRPGEKPAYLDWQSACLAPWGHDVAYFIGSALEPVERQSNERHLLQHYLGHLKAHGGLAPSFDEAWTEYRRHMLHGFAWMCVPTVMQPSDVVRAMARRYAAAIEELDPFALLLTD